jgi:hypothetical protein
MKGQPFSFSILSNSLGTITTLGRALAQTVSSWLPTSAARVWPCEICDGQSGTGGSFLRLLSFLLPSIPPTAPHSSSNIRGWCNRPFGSLSNSGLGYTPPPPKNNNNNNSLYKTRTPIREEQQYGNAASSEGHVLPAAHGLTSYLHRA